VQIVRPGLWGAPRIIGTGAAAASPKRTMRSMRVAALLFLAGCLLLVILAGIVNLQWYGRERIYPALQNAATWLASVPANPRQLQLDIKFKNFRKLAYYREQALAYGFLVQHEESYVPAVIQLSDRRVKAKVRLKGDVVDHLEGDKWSLRIKITDDDAVFGMTFFSIQDPIRSSFAYEWAFHEIMRREGLVAPRYDFIDVTINGRPMGIYALEESFSKEMLEAHARREGPIIRFNERFWIDEDKQVDILFASEVDAFQSGKTRAKPLLRQQFEVARDLLTGFRDQRLPLGQVFDVPKLATYFALIDLCNASHACRWKNIRFYYNPVTSLLEPIPYNAYSARSAAGARVAPAAWLGGQRVYSPYHVAAWMDAFFQDPDFYDAYVKALARISQPEYLDQLLTDIGGALDEKLRILHKDYPAFEYSNDYLYKTANLIRNAVQPRVTLTASWNPHDVASAEPQLTVANTIVLAVSLVDLVDTQTDARYPFPENSRLGPKTMEVPQDVSVRLPDDAVDAFREFSDDRFVLRYHVVGMKEIYASPIHAGNGDETFGPAQLSSKDSERFRRLEMLAIDDARRTIEIRPGRWHINQTVVLPSGYQVSAGPGVQILFDTGASLISYSPVALHGTESQPITVSASEGTGNGLAIISASARSEFRHVRFENLAEPRMGRWSVTGAVTLYESPATFNRCAFVGGRSEDQLNIIRSEFLVEDCRFESAASDALDIDFGKGEIRDCTFTRPKNDAIDSSGSTIRIAGCTIKGVGDKAVSAGEFSRVTVEDCTISEGVFGLVSKDLSELTARRVNITGAVTALAAYQKKPEFGPASIVLDSPADSLASLVEKGSWIEWHGQREDGCRLHVARQVYGR